VDKWTPAFAGVTRLIRLDAFALANACLTYVHFWFYLLSIDSQRKAADGVDMERALETQRLKLLRVLAGLVLAVAFVSGAPLSRDFSRWARGVVASVLSR